MGRSSRKDDSYGVPVCAWLLRHILPSHRQRGVSSVPGEVEGSDARGEARVQALPCNVKAVVVVRSVAGILKTSYSTQYIVCHQTIVYSSY